MTEVEKAKFNVLVEKVADLMLLVDDLKKQLKVYHYFDELPDYAKDTIKELYDKGIYKGAGADDLNLPEALMRMLVIEHGRVCE